MDSRNAASACSTRRWPSSRALEPTARSTSPSCSRPPGCRGRPPTAWPSRSRRTASCAATRDGRFGLGLRSSIAPRAGRGRTRSRSPTSARPVLAALRDDDRRERAAVRPRGRRPALRRVAASRRTGCAGSCPRARCSRSTVGSAGRVLSGEIGPAGLGRERRGARAGRGLGQRAGASTAPARCVAAVSVSGPVERLSRQPGARFGAAVVAAAGAVALASATVPA